MFARWSVFAHPFANGVKSENDERKANEPWFGLKVYIYQDVNSPATRVTKAVLKHMLNIFVSQRGLKATGRGAVGSGVGTVSGKFGGLKAAFDVDIGGIALRHVLANDDNPKQSGRPSSQVENCSPI